MSPFEPVVVEKAFPVCRTEIGIETAVVLVGIDDALADRRLGLARQGRIRRERSISHPGDDQKKPRKAYPFHQLPNSGYRRSRSLWRRGQNHASSGRLRGG